MIQDRRNSAAVKEHASSKCIPYVLDCALSLFILPINGVAFWVSVDNVFLSVTNDVRVQTAIISFCAILFVLMHVACKSIYRLCLRYAPASTFRFLVVSKSYIYVSAVCGAVVYDGCSELMPSSFPGINDILYYSLIVVVSFALLFSMKSYPSIGGGISGDTGHEQTPEEVFLFPFRIYECSWKKNRCLYMLDSIFSVFIIGTLVILVWRGAWCILDIIVFPSDNGDDPSTLSAWASLIIGYAVVIITFIFQSLMRVLMRKFDGWIRLIILDIYIVTSFCGTINVWRGLWLLLEHYIDFEKSLTNCLLVHFFSFFILVIFSASNTLLVRGVYIDAEESGDDCFNFPCYYFRLHFQANQKEKRFEELDKFNPTQVLKVNRKEIDDTSGLPHDAHELMEFISTRDEKLNSTKLGEYEESVPQSLMPSNIDLELSRYDRNPIT